MKDKDFMKLALQLAKSGKGQTSPNPLVGAVVVNGGEIVGVGAHLKAGEPHAEVHAIRMAGQKAKGATVYVTLEPCSHAGKTPPCADLLIDTRVKKVIVATVDPNPMVSGNGIDKLRAAGIEVEVGLCKEEADRLNEIFFHFMKTSLPYVTLKYAASLDGKIATVTGESKWITSAEAREDVHHYRHEHDAILVGVGTVLADNPSLTTRLPNGGKNPIRIILDTTLRTPLNSNVITDGKAPTWIITNNNVSAEKKAPFLQRGITIFSLEDETISIRSFLQLLGERKITSLFVEGGAEVHGSFIEAGFVNQMITYIAPKIIGGKTAPAAIGGEGIKAIKDVLALDFQTVEKVGPDLKIISRLKEKS